MMFGRVRQSSSSLDRPPSKIFKDDPLSIYEATLIKLKLGSQRDLTLPSEDEDAVDMESDSTPVSMELVSMLPTSTKNGEEAMTIDTNTDSSSASQSATDGESMTAESYGSATSSSNSHSFGGTKEHARDTCSSAFTIM